MEKHQDNPFPYIFDDKSEILILGSFPSVKSREEGFYYGHPRNRFWRVLAEIYSEKVPETVDEKRDFLHRNHIALWDVIASCEIDGSSDLSIKNVRPNDIDVILKNAPIKMIFVNGKKAFALYKKYAEAKTGRCAKYLPSTSPANASRTFESLVEEWKKNLIM